MVKGPKLLTERQRRAALKKLTLFEPNKSETKLTAVFTFDDHVAALVFIARITVHAEVQHHHPEITFTHAKVKVAITTHELKGLTKKDITLAQKIEKLEAKRG